MRNLFDVTRIIGIFLLLTIISATPLIAQEWEGDEGAPFQKAYAEGYEKGYRDGQEKMQAEAIKEYDRLKEEYETIFSKEIKKVEQAYQEELATRGKGEQKTKVIDGKELSLYQNKKFDEILAKSPAEIFEEARAKIKNLPDEEIEQNVIEKFADGPVGTLVAQSGLVRRFIVAMIKDDHAAPKLLTIAEEKTRIWVFVFMTMIITVVSYFIGRKLKKETLEAYGSPEDEAVVKKKKLLFLLSKITVWVLLFSVLFGSHLVPTIVILFKSF